ncbi:nuclear envelope pore membrane protein POM 121-like [Tamandua tetradactyla]|uniref:nuclear envelope pore membrane protein POM 121-like n=1 Tax=Tamandua tetradactyla TaxID=48850 RepID=UPI0040546E1B
MGSYLSRRRPQPPSPALCCGDLSERPVLRWPAAPARGVVPARQLHAAAPALDLAGTPELEDPLVSALRLRRGFVVARPRPPPARPRWSLFLGFFSASGSGSPMPALAAGGSDMFRTSVVLKSAPTKDRPTVCLALKQVVRYLLASFSARRPRPCGTEIPIKALEEGNNLRAKEEGDPTALGEVREGAGRQERGHVDPESPRCPSRGPGGRGPVRSAFTPLGVDGALSSLVPRPGPLKRDLCVQSSKDSLAKKLPTSFLSSCSKRNAIMSSYSSTRGFCPLQSRSRPGAALLPGPRSTHPQVPAEKASEEGHSPSPSASEASPPGRKIQEEKVSDAPSGQNPSLGICSPASVRAGPQKRKVPLLLPSRRKPLLPLAPPLQLGRRVTAEDLDLEKKAAMQWINQVLKVEEQWSGDVWSQTDDAVSCIPADGKAAPLMMELQPSAITQLHVGHMSQPRRSPQLSTEPVPCI